mgnify:FL=1
MPITVMISLVVTVALFLISLLFRIAARLNLTLPLLYFLAVSTILNPWAASHEKLAFAILYLLILLLFNLHRPSNLLIPVFLLKFRIAYT